MNKQFIIFSLLLALATSQSFSITSCTCAQLLSEGDCIKNINLGCSWDNTKKSCAVSTTPVAPTTTYIAYCDAFAETDCPKAKPCTDCGAYSACAWTENKCTFFTGCTAFAKTTDPECQAISNRCITDGTHCVELDACSTYKKQLPCVKNAAGSLCYWDTTNNTCVDANNCDRLPITFVTDKECRDKLPNCTTKTGGGCIDSGNNCSDQTLEIQCVWNKLGTTACYWDGAACKDRICDNAPTTLTTDETCKTFRTDSTCTTKPNGGCVTRTTCAAATIQAACIKNSSGGDCYWTGTACVDKTCTNAPTTMTTNSACAGFVTGCITKSGGGCVANGACSVANLPAACVKNSSGTDCIFDGTCKEKTCANSPTTNNTHELCTSYLASCTVKSGGGCQNRSCSNAPITTITNDACEAYYPANNCITKTGGGCVTNTTCAAITLEVACVKNSSGQPCVWDVASSSCKDKICINAPLTKTTNELCQEFLNTCTVNSAGAGCVEKTCENSLVLAICDKDKNNKACIWKGKCYKKQCVLASSATTSHTDCQTYHSSCTLSNTGSGCVPLPLKCEAITIEAACQIKANGSLCGWTGSQCIDKACSTASKTFTTTSQCQGHILTCVANNPVTINGSLTIQGCQDLPTTCGNRKSIENCEISRSGFPTCLWVSSTTTCVEKSCSTASTVGTNGVLTIVNFTNCQNYLSVCTATNASGSCTATSKPCISNNNSDGCITKPSSCSGLVQQNCKDGSKSSGDCYWNGSNCVDKTCSNIIQTSHNNCIGIFDQCTVNNGGTACQALATACTAYTTQENCKKTSTNKNCIWTGLACRSATCADAPDTTLFDSDTECLGYPTPSETCTVVYKVGASGCVPKSTNCTDYMTQAQCHKTILNLTATDDCKWIVDKCYALSTFATGSCTTFKGTQQMCQGYRAGCTNVLGATSSTSCTLDCTLKTGSNLSFQDCQALDTICSVKKDGSGCLAIQSSCAGYVLQANCFRAGSGLCGWNGSACLSITTAAECVHVSGLTGLDQAKCQGYNPLCTSLVDGTGCQEQKTKCSDYTTLNTCATSSQGKCYLDGSDCVRFSNCASIVGTGLTDENCDDYDVSCVANANKTACQEKMLTCNLYLTQNSCTTSAALGTAAKCAWNGTACVTVTTASTDCLFVTGSGLTDTICASYNAGCTANKAGDACQEKKATCAAYGTTTTACSISSAGKCALNGSNCVAVATVATDCLFVTGSGLTDTICASYNAGCTANKAGTACQEKKATCANYIASSACSKSSDSGTSANCAWNGTTCFSVGIPNLSVQCAYVTGSGLTDTICASYNAGCTANKAGDACQEKKATCTAYGTTTTACSISSAGKCALNGSNCVAVATVATDCLFVTGSGLTDTICASYNAGCTANKAGDACQEKKAACTGYGTTTTACSISSAGKCALNGSNCVAVTTVATDCLFVTGSGLTDTICASYNAGCTANKAGDACQEKKAACTGYGTTTTACSISSAGSGLTDTISCSISSAGKCALNGSNCVAVTTVATDCLFVTGSGLTDTICASYNAGCTANKAGDACQEKKAACTGYGTTTTACSISSAGKCALNGSNCVAVTTVATDCLFVTGSGLTDTICASYNAGCTANKAGDACQEKKAACTGYGTTTTACSISSAGKCALNGSNCVAVTTVATDCLFVTGSGLTDTICASYNAGCTANKAGTACQEKKATCTAYGSTQAACSTSSDSGTASQCVWSGSTCLTVGIALLSTECAYVTGSGLTDTICASYNAGCTANKAGDACQEKKATCAAYGTTTTACSISSAGSGLTDTICASYNAGCTANKAGTACQEKKSTCAAYIASTTCSTSSDTLTAANCVWGGQTPACLSVTIVATHCAYITGTGLTNATCASYNAGCASLKDGTGCQEAKSNCKDYTTQNKCSYQTTGSLACLWIDNSCYPITDKNCAVITGTGLDHAKCQAYSTGCTSVTGGTSCQDFKTTCEQYPGTAAACTKTAATPKCYLFSSTCITILNVATDCLKITGPAGSITYEICQSYNTGCSVNRAKSACVQQQAICSGYTSQMNSCYRSTAGLCIASTNTDTACVAASTAATCETVFLGSTNYSSANCNEMKTGCTVNGTTACATKTCLNAIGPFNHTNCKDWLNTCTVNAGNSACQTMVSKCSDQSSTSCLYSVEGECVQVGTTCVRKTCDTAATDNTRDDDGECSAYLQSCTVARQGACQARTACALYKSQLQCKFNTSGGTCFWNPNNKTCVDLNCGNIETTTSFDTDAECAAVDPSCTVRATNNLAAPGCMARGACNSYTIEEQCKTNASSGVCVWNTNANLPAPACQDKSCTSAPTTTTTHNDCYAYYNTATIKCTVVATPSTSGGNPTLGGCQQTAACSTYIDKEQCQINANGDPCGWNGTQCADKACATAPATADYDDDTKCRAYITNKCTVSDSGQGCVDIPATCETMTQKQCYYNKAGDPCYWNGTACITRTCENAPEATATADECNTYLPGCTLDTVKCKTKVCEDFAFATDTLCKQALSTCTTNGTYCVTRGTCFQALSQAGCIMSSTDQYCEWIPAVTNSLNQITSPAFCTIKNCSTAPITLTSEAACAGYFPNCTTKNGGGCVTKSTCSAVTIDVACTTALNGTICAWDNAQNKCRDKDCQDFSGTSHAACQGQRAGCTVGASGKCARIQNCEQTTIRSACIEGTNGPCLWINDYINTDGSTGACFRYTSCKSLTWNSDAQCKWISKQCTTNGSNCIGITLCSETNTDGGCVTGYDGACIQSVPALNSSDPKVCKPYTSCADAFYTTHSDCQIASKKCTTNGLTGCIALGQCSSYTSQAGCVFNDKGTVLTSGVITSTGICTWDATASSCRDQSCADLTGTNHAACSSQLSTCTSDGTTCLLKGACSSYTTQTACTTAIGSDGNCYWELASATNNNTAKCRLLTCSDIQNGTATNVCSVALQSCISNGTACIPKANCSTYKNKISCNSGGLDGICVFTLSTATGAAADSGTCASMTACTTANNDQTACQQARDRCSWTPASGTGTTAVASKCVSHTCATNQATNGVCTRILNWDKKTQQVCTLVSGTCTATDPSTLSSNDCFLISGYTYTWNASTSKCGVCTAPVVQPNNTDNNTNNTNNETTTDSGYILGLSTIIFGYLML
ncbi:unnamed protein product [Paramecium pentaurelia]|uniref:PSI domain-containing protein n=1 Tax=Paramecium pentaurelia TaxID=43138 RepID=A0A8S1VJL5_9CILI|nr:unnamed protein product [Paramecium pentaurelia]